MVDDLGRPRYWATIWADVLNAGVDDGTRARQLTAVEALYRTVAMQTGKDGLDGMIAALDFDGLESALGGFLSVLRNDSAIHGIDRDQTWTTALAVNRLRISSRHRRRISSHAYGCRTRCPGSPREGPARAAECPHG